MIVVSSSGNRLGEQNPAYRPSLALFSLGRARSGPAGAGCWRRARQAVSRSGGRTTRGPGGGGLPRGQRGRGEDGRGVGLAPGRGGSPPTTSSRIRSHSNSAIAASTWNRSRPEGVVQHPDRDRKSVV